MMMKLRKYDSTVHYEAGESMNLADMLSRGYLPFKDKEMDDFELVNMVRFFHIWPASGRNKRRDAKGPVSARIVRDQSPRIA